MSLAYLTTTQVYVLINYTAFIESLFVTFSVAALLWLRYKRPNLERPIKVNIALPILFFVVCIFLVFLPFPIAPWETGIGIIITLSGVPVYLLTIYWKAKPRIYKNMIGKTIKKFIYLLTFLLALGAFTRFVQRLLCSVQEDVKDY